MTEIPSVDSTTFRRLRPRQYLERYLIENIRIDGRKFDQFRETHLNKGSIDTANGSSVVRLGNTTMICGIKCQTAQPDPNRNCGYIVPNVDLNPISNSKFKPGPPGDEAQSLSSTINDIILSSNLVDLKDLIIEPFKAVWVLYIDVICLDFDGNAFDAALLSIMTALKDCTLPTPTFDVDSEEVICSPTQSQQLKLQKTLIPSTFGVFDDYRILADMNDFEQSLASTHITIVLDENDNFCFQSQTGKPTGESLSSSLKILNNCISLSKHRSSYIKNLLI